jgi:hypothetical protein
MDSLVLTFCYSTPKGTSIAPKGTLQRQSTPVVPLKSEGAWGAKTHPVLSRI